MNGKILLISPPDFFENSNPSILLGHIDEKEEETIGRWLKESSIDSDINFYVYSGEPNASWFLYALNRCEYKYINLDSANYITQSLAGYALAKSDVYYRVSDPNVASVYSHINSKRVDNIENFLESIIGAQTSQS